MRYIARALVLCVLVSIVLPGFLLLWMNFSPDPLAGQAVERLNARLATIARTPQRANHVERLGFGGLYTGMYVGGRVWFPEAADNLYHLFRSVDSRDQMLHSGRLFWSPTLRRSIHMVATGQSRWGHVACAKLEHEQKRCTTAPPSGPDSFLTTDLRTFFLYNPWQIRIEEGRFFRTVAIFQWMKFVQGTTPFLPGAPRPIQLRDDLLEINGGVTPYTAYNLWIEPRVPTGVYAAGAVVLHVLRGVIGVGALLLMIPLFGFALRRKMDVVYRWLWRLSAFGLTMVGLRILWDLTLDLSAAMLVWDGGSEAWTAYTRSDLHAVRPRQTPGEGVGGVLFATLTHLVHNVVCAAVCMGMCQLARGRLRSPALQIGVTAMMAFPLYGLPMPLAIALMPTGLVLLWRVPLDEQPTSSLALE